MNKYTKEQIDWLREYVPGRSYKECWEAFNERYPDTYIDKLVNFSSMIKRYGILNGRNTRFKKGAESYNKGKKQTEFMSPEAIERSSVTRFKKGHVPHNYVKVGSESKTTDGYNKVKIKEPNIWKLKARLVWEENNGPIPAGGHIIHKNGIKDDDRIENLELVTRGEIIFLNKIGLIKGEQEVNEAAITLARLKMKTLDVKKSGDTS